MATEQLEQAIATTRGVLTGVSKDQLAADTPCAEWKVSDLINHIVGGQRFFTAGIKGEPPSGGEVDYSGGDFVAEFDKAATQTVAAFGADGAMQKMCNLPFGSMPGAAFIGLATTDTFTHGWDLAKATGQDTNLSPELASQLLVGARAFIQDSLRSPAGNPFGMEQQPPAGASNADELAAFLGRSV